VVSADDVARLYLGYFTAPEGHHLAGQRIVTCAYLIRHPEGLILFDTGIGEGDDEAEAFYRPVRQPVPDALTTAGVDAADIRIVVNCHLHFDHSGFNNLFPARPIFAQRAEYEEAHDPDYTMPHVVDFPGAKFELIEGEAEMVPGIWIVPTPGHTAGHQSLVVETRQGRLVLAGQAFNETSEYAAAQFGWRLAETGREADVRYPDWIRRFQEFDPWRVLFAHDVSVWEADPAPVSLPGSAGSSP
jgi:N-acyl homoserine lactone hydrolase